MSREALAFGEARGRRFDSGNVEVKKAGRYAEDERYIVRAFALAWGIGGFIVALTELLVNGENLLDSGGSWVSWFVGALASILTFTSVLMWARRKRPPAN